MHIVIVCGSHRRHSQSSKVAHYIKQQILEQQPGSTTSVIDLAGNPLPLWDEELSAESGLRSAVLQPILKQLQDSDAVVVVTPEWAGMVPAGLKNLLLLCSARELGDKPGLIVSVSAGAGGAYPVAELRMSGYKNNFICWIPHHVIVRQVESVLNTQQAASEADTYIRGRLAHSLRILTKYADGLRLVRESCVVDHSKFPNGM